MELDTRYIALKLIRWLYEQKRINRESFDCVMQTYGSSAEKAAR